MCFNNSMLYKYLTPEICIKILESMTLRFSQPSLFNDPFESKPIIKNIYRETDLSDLFSAGINANQSQIAQVLINSFNSTIVEYDAKLVTDLSDEEKINFFFNRMSKEASSLEEFVLNNLDKEAFKEETINSFIQILGLHIGVLSLTEDPNNLLMWAHYAKSHTGFVLEFDNNHPFFNSVENPIYPPCIKTVYQSERPIINVNLFTSDQ